MSKDGEPSNESLPKCECNSGWDGIACQCKDDYQGECEAHGQICMGVGNCTCSVKRPASSKTCTCNDGFEGKYCQHPSGLDNSKICAMLQPCVKLKLVDLDFGVSNTIVYEILDPHTE